VADAVGAEFVGVSTKSWNVRRQHGGVFPWESRATHCEANVPRCSARTSTCW